jgi:hypothetical protein
VSRRLLVAIHRVSLSNCKKVLDRAWRELGLLGRSLDAARTLNIGPDAFRGLTEEEALRLICQKGVEPAFARSILRALQAKWMLKG